MNKFEQKLMQIKKDPEQYAAYISDDSSVVIAGPGSGKTTVLTLKIIRLLREKIYAPRGLACMTYNRSAASEFKSRLQELGFSPRQNVFLGTVHSFCISEVITPFATLYDYGIPLPLKVISNTDRRRLFNNVVAQLGLDNVELKIEEMDKERTLHIEGMSGIIIPTYDVAATVAKEYELQLHRLNWLTSSK